jgi:hypothetical protein
MEDFREKYNKFSSKTPIGVGNIARNITKSPKRLQELHHIGTINYANLRDAILDLKIYDTDKVVLHISDYDNVLISSPKPVKTPLILLGVLIEEDIDDSVPKDRIGVIRVERE